MKIGMRSPSPKRSIKARTTGRVKRSIKKSLIPGYGQKGMGWIKNPKKAAYNMIYNKTTFSFWDLFKKDNSVSRTTDMNVIKSIKTIVIIAVSLFVVLLIIGSINEGKKTNENKSVTDKVLTSESLNKEINNSQATDYSSESDKQIVEKDTELSTEITTLKESIIKATEFVTSTTQAERVYIVNKSSKKFHYPTCQGVKEMKSENKREINGTRQELIDRGYSPCKKCNP